MKMAAFPGVKVLTYGPIFKGLKGNTSGVPAVITKAKVTIPSSRLTGTILKIYMKTASGNDWEEVSNGIEYTFTNSGSEIYLQIVASGATISAKKSDGALIPGIILKVLEYS